MTPKFQKLSAHFKIIVVLIGVALWLRKLATHLGARLLFCGSLQLATRSSFAASTSALETIGMYHVPPGDYGLVKSLGIEAIQAPLQTLMSPEQIQSCLADAQKNSLKVIFGVYGKIFELRQILRTIETYKSHPAIAYWYLADEPDAKGIEPDTIRQITNLVRVTDPKRRPTFITISDLNFGPKDEGKVNIRPKAYSAYKDAADRAGVFRYDPPKKLKIYLDAYIFPEFAPGKGWWAVVSLNQKPEELKHSVAMFMEGQPAGLLYYAFADESWGFNLREREDIQAALKEINAGLRGRSLEEEKMLEELAGASQSNKAPARLPGMPPIIRSPVMNLSRPTPSNATFSQTPSESTGTASGSTVLTQ